MFRFIAIAALLSLPVAAIAQDDPVPDKQAESGKPPQRVRSVTLTGNQACPKPASDDEIVVCSKLNEPYRIPKGLRESKPDAAQQSWVNRAETLDQVGRVAGGLPDTCSPIGSGGQTGCTMQMLQQWQAEKAEQNRQQSAVP
jgi:hypothetical protein